MRTGSLEGLIAWLMLSEKERNRRLKEAEKERRNRGK